MAKLWIPPTPFLSGSDDAGKPKEPDTLVMDDKKTKKILSEQPHAKNERQQPLPHMPANSQLLKERYRSIYKIVRDCPEGLMGCIIFPEN
jgi:hypothetical protein